MGEEKTNSSRASEATLFPILPASATGLARMAAEAEHADDGHLVEFKTMKVRSILNRIVSKRQLWMAYGINPYRGCEFACRYCYARYTHEFLQPKDGGSTIDYRAPEAFERLIFLKQNAAWLLQQELCKIDPADEIAIGTATDPYQPIERRARITRSLLEVFARRSGYRLGIVTKSTLIARDIDLLTEIARNNTLVLHQTITTPDAGLARILEPRAPRPDLRLQTVRRLREAGLTAGILCSPLLPGITDTAEAIDAMAAQAAAVGASFFSAQPLFLKPCSRPPYLGFVQEHFPHLLADTTERFRENDFATKPYRQHLAALVAQARTRHDLGPRPHDTLLTSEIGNTRRTPASSRPPQQQQLFA